MNYGMQPPPGYVFAGNKMFPSFAKKLQIDREREQALAQFKMFEEQAELEQKKRETREAYFEYVEKMLKEAANTLENWLRSHKCPLISIVVFQYEHEISVSVATKHWAEFIMRLIVARGKASAEYDEFCDSFGYEHYCVSIKCKPYYFVG